MSSDAPQPPEATNQFQLLRTRRFLPFFLTQFLGALNDNLFKNAMVLLITFQLAQASSEDSAVLVQLAAGVFILPFFLFSATSGQLADKYERSRLIRLVKLFEIAIAVVGSVGFVTHHVALLFVALFMLGMHSSLFGPVKYAILPQQLRERELVGGNALVESGTFVAILFGTILAGVLMARSEGASMLVPAATIGVAALGYLASRGVPLAPAPDPSLRVNWNPIPVTWRTIQYARANRPVFLSVLGISWYWFLGAMMLAQFPAYAKTYLGGHETMVTLLLAVFAIGVGLRIAAVRMAVGSQDRDRAGPVRVDRALRLHPGSVPGQPCAWRHGTRESGCVRGDSGELAHPGRSGADRRLRRFLYRPAVRAGTGALGSGAPCRASSQPTTSSMRCSWSSPRCSELRCCGRAVLFPSCSSWQPC